MHGYDEVPKDNVQGQFVYFIVGICLNTFKITITQFLEEKVI